MKRQMGILLPIPSLPGQEGIGSLGLEARQFLDILAHHHIGLWQILPINPLGYGHSPYQPYSSKAGEPALISLSQLKQDGYIQSFHLENFPADRIDYEYVNTYKEPYFEEAYRTMKADQAKQHAFQTFRKTQPWVEDYGIFYAFKKHHRLQSWLTWEDAYRTWPKTRDPKLIAQHQASIEYAIFLQFLFYTQWQKIKDYAHRSGIQILGDIPFYVGIDSLDVWMNQEEFLLDQAGKPTAVKPLAYAISTC